MPDWLHQLLGPALSGGIAGLVLVAGLRVEVRALKELVVSVAASNTRAHDRITDHIERHHIKVRPGQ